MKNGVPWIEAMKMEPEDRFAMVVVFAEFDGLVFNWQTGTMERPKR